MALDGSSHSQNTTSVSWLTMCRTLLIILKDNHKKKPWITLYSRFRLFCMNQFRLQHSPSSKPDNWQDWLAFHGHPPWKTCKKVSNLSENVASPHVVMWWFLWILGHKHGAGFSCALAWERTFVLNPANVINVRVIVIIQMSVRTQICCQYKLCASGVVSALSAL